MGTLTLFAVVTDQITKTGQLNGYFKNEPNNYPKQSD
jgi:hypothetical protein